MFEQGLNIMSNLIFNLNNARLNNPNTSKNASNQFSQLWFCMQTE